MRYATVMNARPEFDDAGKAVAELRRRLGLSQEQLADDAGLSQQTISKLENREITNPRPMTMFKILKALHEHGAPIDELRQIGPVEMSRYSRRTGKISRYKLGQPSEHSMADDGIIRGYYASEPPELMQEEVEETDYVKVAVQTIVNLTELRAARIDLFNEIMRHFNKYD